ncbi:MAG: hypothetical protein COB04_07695 [Gammaproteobacteria bacterium]|nr:MAG: hypothetical protein COB04_07695 [Gammaproteobacteria bacterium]
MSSATAQQLNTFDKSLFADAYLESGWPQNLNLDIEVITGLSCRLRLPYSDDINNGTNSIHGGIIASSMHDAALMLATHVFRDQAELVVRAIDFQISFLRAAKRTDLFIEAKLSRSSKRIAFINVVATDRNGQIVASVNGCFGTWEDESTSQVSQEIIRPLLTRSVSDHPLKQMMCTMIDSKIPGMALEEMGEGFCKMSLENIEHYQNQHGDIAPGALLTLVDNVGAFASLAAISAFGMGSTVDLKLTMCDTAKNEGVIGVAEAMSCRGSQLSSRVSLVAEKSKKLIGFGTVSLWVKF